MSADTPSEAGVQKTPADTEVAVHRASVSAPGLASDEDAAVLAKMGYKQELRRNFSMIEVFGIAFSIMGLLPSIASTLSFSIPAGPVGMVWGWFVASAFIFVVGLAMADLGSSMPTSGGLYYWTHFYASPKWRKYLCFLVGYSNTLGLVGGLCSIDYGFALMFVSVITIARDGNWSPSNGVIYAIFLCCVLLHGVFASTLAKVMGKLQTVFVVLNFILIFATIIALPIGKDKRNDAAYIFSHMENLTTWPTGWSFMLAWLSPIWTIGGFDSCVHLSEEASNAKKAVPFGILMSIGSCWLFGFIILIAIAACMSTDLDSILSSPFGQPMAQIYYDALGKNGALGLMSLLMIVQFLMGLSILVAASRQTWAFTRDGALPFSRYLRKVSVRLGYIPARAVWFCVLLAAILGLLCLIASAAASALFSLAVAGNNLAWGGPILSRLVWGQNKFVPGPIYTGDRFSRPIGWLAVIFLIFGILLAMFPDGGPNPSPSDMNYTVVINSAVWLGATAYYILDARKWFKGPKITVDLDDLTEEQQQVIREEGIVVEELEGKDVGGAIGRKSGEERGKDGV
ncbi:putative gaba permease [Phaeomoniella chlamydospora]|uniref:Putative gaba permease n=1 Tax=Phaeomoniella chlamydospora TaxID=158046 RepID=A0A0G2EIZ1_PHACM|nr:putative gaba permease [Phaeomoniella chlamydospora]